MKRQIDRSIGKGEEFRDPHIPAHCCRRGMHRDTDLQLNLKRDEPVLALSRYRRVLDRPVDVTRFAELDPSDLGQLDPAFLDRDVLREPERVILEFLAFGGRLGLRSSSCTPAPGLSRPAEDIGNTSL